MKRGIYIHRVNYMDERQLDSYGVYKKIKTQCNVLSEFFDIKLKTINVYKKKDTIINKIVRRLPFTSIVKKWEYTEEYNDVDFLYIRRTDIDFSLIQFLKRVKCINKKCKVIFEIPTFPYDKEIFSSIKDLKQLPFLLKDVVNRNKLKKYVDAIVIFTNEKNIFGVNTLNLLNGIDFNENPIRNIRSKNENSINIIMVAYFAFWHGYDRLLKGLGEYYKNGGTRNIILHFVGHGEAVKMYQEIINKYQLKYHVIFHGWKSGSELNKIYDNADIAVDVLGGHRKDYYLSSSLKSREYCAKGLPFITECKMDFLSSDCPYVLTVPYDESDINILDIISFYDNLYTKKSPIELAQEIREYAYKHCDMHVTMKPVIDFINQ